ncbi:MAG: DNA repair protein RadC [Peptococcaceae bacterium]|nr:DNA repair protein RadC [Peptococcaceae bacterium]
MAVDYKVRIKDLPTDLMPRERMATLGTTALSNSELLALVLGSGNRRENALDMSARILADAGGWRGLAGLSLGELENIVGIGRAKACQIQALLEIGRRMATAVPETRPTVRCPDDAANLVMEDMRYLDREHFRLMALNSKNQVLGVVPVAVGSLNAAPVHPREVFKEAIRRSAAAIILLHNHPSGDPTPSREDVEVTKRLAEAGHLLGIEVFDHLVIGDKRYVSLKEKGIL